MGNLSIDANTDLYWYVFWTKETYFNKDIIIAYGHNIIKLQ
jgi:hypothetical protein